MTTRIRFDAPQHHTLNLGRGVIINGGQAYDVDDELAQTLVDATWIDVTVIPPGASVWPKSNGKLDELADRLGVTWPEPDEGKKLTAQDKTAVLEEAGYTPDSVYQGGDDTQDTATGEPPAGEGDSTDDKEINE